MRKLKITFVPLLCCLLSACSISVANNSSFSSENSSSLGSSQSRTSQSLVDFDAFKNEANKHVIGNHNSASIHVISTINGESFVEDFELELTDQVPNSLTGYAENVFAYLVKKDSNHSDSGAYSFVSSLTFIRDALSIISYSEQNEEYKTLAEFYINPLGWGFVSGAGSEDFSSSLKQQDTYAEDLFVKSSHVEIESSSTGKGTNHAIMDCQFRYL